MSQTVALCDMLHLNDEHGHCSLFCVGGVIYMPLCWISSPLFPTSFVGALWNECDWNWADVDRVRADRCCSAAAVSFPEFTATQKRGKSSEEMVCTTAVKKEKQCCQADRSQILWSTSPRRVVTFFGHDDQWMYNNDFPYPLTFPVRPPWFWLFVV